MAGNNTRVNILVEGQTEETFVNRMLVRHLANFQVWLTPRIIRTSKGHQGGVVSFAQICHQVRTWCQQDNTALVICSCTNTRRCCSAISKPFVMPMCRHVPSTVGRRSLRLSLVRKMSTILGKPPHQSASSQAGRVTSTQSPSLEYWWPRESVCQPSVPSVHASTTGYPDSKRYSARDVPAGEPNLIGLARSAKRRSGLADQTPVIVQRHRLRLVKLLKFLTGFLPLSPAVINPCLSVQCRLGQQVCGDGRGDEQEKQDRQLVQADAAVLAT